MTMRLLLAVIIGFCLVMSGGRSTAAETGGATAQVRQVLDRAMEIQTQPDLQGEAHRKERANLIRRLIDDNFLSKEMARDSLSGSWGGLSGQQRSEFEGLFARLFQDSYTRLVLNFLQRETVEYRGETVNKDTTEVSTMIMRANEHIPVNYQLTQRGQRWHIVDVVIDGVSIVENYKISFGRVIRSSSFAALLQKMRLQSKSIQDDIS
jgi:phospholipid transport system substrate-binding protein